MMYRYLYILSEEYSEIGKNIRTVDELEVTGRNKKLNILCKHTRKNFNRVKYSDICYRIPIKQSWLNTTKQYEDQKGMIGKISATESTIFQVQPEFIKSYQNPSQIN